MPQFEIMTTLGKGAELSQRCRDAAFANKPEVMTKKKSHPKET
jgi:hypothetical protein